jgi:hypothetical protein
MGQGEAFYGKELTRADAADLEAVAGQKPRKRLGIHVFPPLECELYPVVAELGGLA